MGGINENQITKFQNRPMQFLHDSVISPLGPVYKRYDSQCPATYVKKDKQILL